jgi:membrane fusion protein (multidrug efflux system)
VALASLAGIVRIAVAFGTPVCLAVGCGEPRGATPSGPPPVRVQIVTVEPRALPRTISSVGTLESPEMTTVASEIEGRIVALDVPEGRRVEAGHLLARLDDAEARAALSVARARLTNARDRLKRLESLRAESVSSEQAYDDAKSGHEEATGAYDEARTRLEKTTIVAPFAGVLGLRQVNVGQFVESGTAIVELTQVDPLELIFGIPQRFAGELAVGQAVQGRVGSCGARFEGAVEAIDPRVDASTRSVRLQARIPNPGGSLYPGMAVSLRIVVGEIEEALVVPQEAVVRQGTEHVVYTLDADDRAEQHRVDLGRFFVDGVHVRAGISSGARVVAAGQQKLRPGSATRPEPFEPVDNPNLELGREGGAGACGPPA